MLHTTLSNRIITMPLKKTSQLALSIALCLNTLPGFAADDNKLQRLLEQGHYWYERGQLDRASNAWNKVIGIAPNNIEAQTALQELARYQQRNIDTTKLEEARKLTQEGHYQQATVAYQSAFNGTPPNSHLAVEYYQTLAATPAGRAQAIAELQTLVARYPSNSKFRLALAKTYSYHAETRRQGIRALDEMTQTHPNYGAEAQQAWRDALLWLEARADDEPLYQRYLDHYPNSPDVQQRLQQLQAGLNPQSDLMSNAYQQLNKGQLTLAMTSFLARLREAPDDAEALAGTGLVYLRQKRFDEAEKVLTEAMVQDPAKAVQWHRALTSAKYWQQIKLAKQQRILQSPAEAAIQFELAREIDPQQAEAYLQLAELARQQQQPEKATAYLQQGLQHAASKKRIAEALASQRIAEGKTTEAMQLAKRYRLDPQRYQQQYNNQLASQMAGESKRLDQQQLTGQALSKLQSAKAIAPNNLSIRFELARLYLQHDQAAQAFAQFDDRIGIDPEAHYYRALIANEAQQWQRGLNDLEQIPVNARTDAHKRLQHQLWGGMQKSALTERLADGDRAAAQQILTRLGNAADNDATLLAIYAGAQAEMGMNDTAIITMQRALQLADHSDIGLKLNYAQLLASHGNQADLQQIMDQLPIDTSTLTRDQQAQLSDIERTAAIRDSHRLREAGELSLAYERLLPWLQSHRSYNIDVMQAMAALYADAGDLAPANELYQSILLIEPDNVAAHHGAVGSAIGLGNLDLATTLMTDARQQQPHDLSLQALQGELLLLKGEKQRGIASIEQSLAAFDARQPAALHENQLRTAGNGPVLLLSTSGSALAQNNYPFSPYLKDQTISAHQTPHWVNNARSTLSQYQQNTSRLALAGLSMHGRSGDEGIDDLTTLSLPIGFHKGLDNGDAFQIGIEPISLDAGTLSGKSSNAKNFGSLALDTGLHTANYDQKADGVALSARYQSSQFIASLGTTPLGFEDATAVGQFTWTPRTEQAQWAIGIQRQAVKESLLSYAGAKDPYTQKRWGAVTQAGIDAKVTLDRGDYGIYTTLGASGLSGDNVKDNNEVNLAGGVYWKMLNNDEEQLQLGVHLGYQEYEHNLSHFSFGHGGYFSPQKFVRLGMPIQYRKRQGAFHYQLSADIGLQHVQQDAADYFPNNPDLQQSLVTAAENNNALQASYDSDSNTGIGYNLGVKMEYTLDSNITLGGLLQTNNAKDYNEYQTLFFATYNFDGQASRKGRGLQLLERIR